MKVYYSCNCRQCKLVPSGVKGAHKRQAHRTFRRRSKEALRIGDETTPKVSTGYKS